MKNEDILKMNNGKKFDIVLMNPPYAQNLHLKFLEKVLNISESFLEVFKEKLNFLNVNDCSNKEYLLQNFCVKFWISF